MREASIREIGEVQARDFAQPFPAKDRLHIHGAIAVRLLHSHHRCMEHAVLVCKRRHQSSRRYCLSPRTRLRHTLVRQRGPTGPPAPRTCPLPSRPTQDEDHPQSPGNPVNSATQPRSRPPPHDDSVCCGRPGSQLLYSKSARAIGKASVHPAANPTTPARPLQCPRRMCAA